MFSQSWEIVPQNGRRFPKVGDLPPKLERVFPELGNHAPKWETFSQSWGFVSQSGAHFPKVGNLPPKVGDKKIQEFHAQVTLLEAFERHFLSKVMCI